jgi:predicted NACHT family NTPase
MHRPFNRRLAAITLLFVLAGGLLALGRYLSERGMAWAAQFASIGAFFAGVLALFAPVLAVLAKWLRRPPASRWAVKEAADHLANALQRQWTTEENARQVNDPGPLPVRWAATTTAEEAMRGVRIGSSGTDRSLEAPLKLAGGFEDALPMFQSLPTRRLVILGTAGAGKSVLAIKLAQGLLADRPSGGLVPVIFPADTWDPARSFSEWMADELIRDHPWLAFRDKAATGDEPSLASALASTSVLPIVDGLDELPEDLRIKAATEINAAGSNRPLIVTSRPAEYLQAIATARPISRAMVMELLPLRITEAKEYLEEATATVPAGRWQAVLA